jgi:hypothetical protein
MLATVDKITLSEWWYETPLWTRSSATNEPWLAIPEE